MDEFVVLLRTLVILTIACGVLAIVTAIASTMIPMPLAGSLVGTFTDTFKLGGAAILGLIGGGGRGTRRR